MAPRYPGPLSPNQLAKFKRPRVYWKVQGCNFTPKKSNVCVGKSVTTPKSSRPQLCTWKEIGITMISISVILLPGFVTNDYLMTHQAWQVVGRWFPSVAVKPYDLVISQETPWGNNLHYSCHWWMSISFQETSLHFWVSGKERVLLSMMLCPGSSSPWPFWPLWPWGCSPGKCVFQPWLNLDLLPCPVESITLIGTFQSKQFHILDDVVALRIFKVKDHDPFFHHHCFVFQLQFSSGKMKSKQL